MDQSQSRTIRYAVAGLCVLALLMLFGWFVLRELPPSSEPPPVGAVTALPRARNVDPLFTPDDEAPHETLTNQVAGSETANTNAAAIYRQAFAIFDTLSQTQKDLVANWRTNVDSLVEAELCEKIQPICDLLHQAAAVSNCDWGLEQPITGNTLLPYLSLCRNLTRAAVWSVAHCRTDDPSAAVDDLMASSRLGQNVSSPPMLIGHLVDLAIQGMVIDSVTEHASTLVGAGDARLVELLNNANYDDGLRHAFELEADMMTREVDRLAALPTEEMKRQLEGIESFANNPSRFQSLEPAQIIADMRQVAELRGQYVQALGLPEADYHNWLTSLDEAGKANPFVELFVEPLESAVIRTQAMTVRSAMAAAGLAVMQGGPDALQSHPDPSTGQPFTYAQTADGFELQSSFQFQEKPVKLSFK
jgi:hypothetical protein